MLDSSAWESWSVFKIVCCSFNLDSSFFSFSILSFFDILPMSIPPGFNGEAERVPYLAAPFWYGDAPLTTLCSAIAEGTALNF